MTSLPVREEPARDEAIEKLADRFAVPLQDGVASQALSLLSDPDVSLTRVAKVIERDPSLSARILKLANSAYFGVPGSVSSVPRAVTMLGVSMVRSVTVTAAAGVLVDRASRVPTGFWNHTSEVAAASSRLSRALGLVPGDAMAAAMLHELGWAFLHRHDPARLAEIRALYGDAVADLCRREQEAFGIDHTVLCATVLQRWNLPEPLIHAIAHHHDPPDESFPMLTKVVQASVLLGRQHDSAELHLALEAIGLPADPNELPPDDGGASALLGAISG